MILNFDECGLVQMLNDDLKYQSAIQHLHKVICGIRTGFIKNGNNVKILSANYINS
jgi:hypothetical protein